MKKKEFLDELRSKLSGLPKKDADDQISFYDEMISDMVADGKSEEEAIEEIGNTDNAVSDIANKTSMVTLVKEKMRPKRALRVWEILLIALGFPVWFPLVLTGIILLFTAYILLWVGVIVVYVVEFCLATYGVGGLLAFAASAINGATNVGYLALGFLGLGGAILFVYSCIWVTKATLKVAKAILLGIKRAFIRGGNKNA